MSQCPLESISFILGSLVLTITGYSNHGHDYPYQDKQRRFPNWTSVSKVVKSKNVFSNKNRQTRFLWNSKLCLVIFNDYALCTLPFRDGKNHFPTVAVAIWVRCKIQWTLSLLSHGHRHDFPELDFPVVLQEAHWEVIVAALSRKQICLDLCFILKACMSMKSIFYWAWPKAMKVHKHNLRGLLCPNYLIMTLRSLLHCVPNCSTTSNQWIQIF